MLKKWEQQFYFAYNVRLLVYGRHAESFTANIPFSTAQIAHELSFGLDCLAFIVHQLSLAVH